MNQIDRIKVCNAGFTILRDRDITPIQMSANIGQVHEIWAANKDHSSWFKFEGNFKSRAARDRRKKVLLQDPMVIED
jgi:hypothetical protein